MFNDYKMLGRPVPWKEIGIFRPLDLSYRVEFVKGTTYSFRKTYYDYYRRGDMHHTCYWNSPDLEWMAEFTADADSVEKLKDGWAVQRDGYEYVVPMRWGFREISQPAWF